MNQGSLRLPMHLMFKVMTWLIYALGFKILGVSIHALQLTQILPTHAVSALPSLPNIGFYPNWKASPPKRSTSRSSLPSADCSGINIETAPIPAKRKAAPAAFLFAARITLNAPARGGK